MIWVVMTAYHEEYDDKLYAVQKEAIHQGGTAGRSVCIPNETTSKGNRISDCQISNCIFLQKFRYFSSRHHNILILYTKLLLLKIKFGSTLQIDYTVWLKYVCFTSPYLCQKWRITIILLLVILQFLNHMV